MRPKSVIYAMMATTAALASPALADEAAGATATTAQATQLIQSGKAAAAYALLAPELAARAAEPDFNYVFGLAALDSGRTAEAILAFQRVLAVKLDQAEARAELARAYAMTGDVDTARAQFDTVLQDPSLPDPVRQRFTALERGFAKQIAGGGSDVTGFLDVSGGYDSNVNTATNLTSVTIPLFAVFGPGTLNGAARQMHDGYGEAQGGVSGVAAVGRQDRVFGSALGLYHRNFDSAAFDQASATGTFGFAHSFANRDTLSLSGQVQQFWLGRQSYRQAYGAIAQYTHLLKGGRALSLSGQYFRFNYDNQPLLDANRYAVAVSYADRRFQVAASGGHEETRDPLGDAQSNTFGDFSIGAEIPLGPRLASIGGVGGDLRRYDAPDALFLTRRRDERIDASAGLKYLVTKSVSIRPRVTYSRNFSNIAIYDYQRFTASVGVRLEF